jgi:hypothetical protein
MQTSRYLIEIGCIKMLVNAAVASSRRLEVVMVVRVLLPLMLLVAALSVYVAVEVQRNTLASIGITLDDDVLPAARALVETLHGEVAARFTTSSVSDTSAVSVETLAVASPGLRSATDQYIIRFSSAVDKLRKQCTEADSDAVTQCKAPACGVDAIVDRINTFRSATSPVEAVEALSQITRLFPRTLSTLFLESAMIGDGNGMLRRLGASYVELLGGAYMEVTSLHALLHRSESFNADSAATAEINRAIESFLTARAMLRYLLTFQDLPLGADPLLFADITAAATVALQRADAIMPTGASGGTTYLAPQTVAYSLSTINNLYSLMFTALSYADDEPTSDNKVEERGLWVAIAALAVTVLCLFGSAVIIVKHIAAATKRSLLFREFAQVTEMRSVGKRYEPVLASLRTDCLPETKHPSILGKIYDDAAKLIVEIRPFLPQTLFGTLVDDSAANKAARRDRQNVQQTGAKLTGAGSGRGVPQRQRSVVRGSLEDSFNAAAAATVHTQLGTAGIHRAPTITPWDASEHPVRLDATVASTTCTFLHVVSLSAKHEGKRSPDELLAFYNDLLATTVALTNKTGGAMHSVEANGHIVCVWNLNHPTTLGAISALRVGRALCTTFNAIDINIVTGPCMVANAKAGRRRNVVIVGAALELAERVLELNLLHHANLVLDFETFRALGLEDQTICRPIAVLHSNTVTRVVIYSADWADIVNARQRKDYLAAFALYQNGMLEDALAMFNDYLSTHDAHDASAQWIINFLLAYKLRPVNAIAEQAEVNTADRADAMLSLEEVSVWAGN